MGGIQVFDVRDKRGIQVFGVGYVQTDTQIDTSPITPL